MTPMFFGFRERELILTLFEAITGLRMNNAYIRPGGLAADLARSDFAAERRALLSAWSRFCAGEQPAGSTAPTSPRPHAAPAR